MIYFGRPRQKQIFFDGNSLVANGAPSNLQNAQAYPLSVYSSIISSYSYSYFNYATGGESTQTLTSSFASRIGTKINKNDIVIMWEISNDAHDLTSDTNGDQLYANVAAYCSLAKSYGCRLAILTGIARDNAADDASITSRIMACNVHLRNNTSIYDLLIDVGALSAFDQKTDTTNTTYYDSDKTHLSATGYALIASTVYTSLNSSGILN